MHEEINRVLNCMLEALNDNGDFDAIYALGRYVHQLRNMLESGTATPEESNLMHWVILECDLVQELEITEWLPHMIQTRQTALAVLSRIAVTS